MSQNDVATGTSGEISFSDQHWVLEFCRTGCLLTRIFDDKFHHAGKQKYRFIDI